MSVKYAELKSIDKLLTCGICYAYIDTSMMTLCSHNYCSLCIRRYLSYKAQCPVCFVETFEKDLRKNKILDEIITQYLDIKKKFEKESSSKEKGEEAMKRDDSEDTCSLNNFKCNEEIDVPDTNEISHEVSDSSVSTAIISTPCVQRVHQDVSSPSTSTSPKIPSIFTPKSKKFFRNEKNCKIVICPVCNVDVPENNINKHVDDCLKRNDTENLPKRDEVKRKPLVKLVLNLMKDSAVRKKLKEFGLSSQGDRKMLEKRIRRYMSLYNSECDKTNPRPVSELIKQCEEEENMEQKFQKPSNRLNINRNTEQNIIEQQRKIYLTENKNSFNQLITKIKTDNSRKLPVRRDILSEGNFNSENCAKDRSVEDCERIDLLPAKSYIDDSDSNASCPLQMYSSECIPTNFLAVELSSSSDNDSNQCTLTSKQDTSNVPCNVNSTSPDSIVKTENIKTGLVEKENMESMDENVAVLSPNRSRDNINALRKRDKTSMLSDDDEGIGDKNIRKSARLGLSETIGFNNENFSEDILQIEEESQKEEVQSRVACAKSVNSSIKRSTRLKNKGISNRKK